MSRDGSLSLDLDHGIADIAAAYLRPRRLVHGIDRHRLGLAAGHAGGEGYSLSFSFAEDGVELLRLHLSLRHGRCGKDEARQDGEGQLDRHR